MYCTKCGKEISNSSAFCLYCGNPIKKSDSQETNETGNPAAKESAANARSTTAETTYSEPVAKKKKKGLIIGIVAAVVLLAIAGKVLFLVDSFGGKDGSLAGVYEDNDGNYFIFAKDGSYIESYFDGAAFYAGECTVDDDMLLLGHSSVQYHFKKTGDNLKLDDMVGISFFDGTKVEEAPDTVRSLDNLTAQSIVGIYTSPNPNYGDDWHYFFEDGSYLEKIYVTDGVADSEAGIYGNYTIEGDTLIVALGNLTTKYQVCILGDKLFLYKLSGGPNEIYTKVEGIAEDAATVANEENITFNAAQETVTDIEITLIHIDDTDYDETGYAKYNVTGKYSGEIQNGLPHGYGVFVVEDFTDRWQGHYSFTYSGQFKNGIPDGYGTRIWATGWQETGTYTSGLYTPTLAEAIESFGFSEQNYSIDGFSGYTTLPEAIDYMNSRTELFPSSNYEIISKFIDRTCDMQSLVNSTQIYADSLIELDNLEILRATPGGSMGDITITEFLMCDIEGNMVCVYYPCDIEWPAGDFTSKVVALPLGLSFYMDTNEQEYNCVALLGCYIG